MSKLYREVRRWRSLFERYPRLVTR